MKCPHCGGVIDLSKSAEGFEQWWMFYPRKDAKGQARVAYNTAVAKVGPELLLERVKAFRDLTVTKGTERHLIPMPPTWLRGERWGDEELITPSPITQTLSLGVHPSWENNYQTQLTGMIGPAQFSAWFGESELVPGIGKTQLVVTSTMRRNWITKHFGRVLYSVLGSFEIVVRQSE